MGRSGAPFPALGLRPAAGLRGAAWLRPPPALQRPEQRNQHTRGEPGDEVHRDAEAGEVGEAVVAGGVDQGVGLVADRGGEAAAGGEHDADHEGARVDAELLGDADHHRGEQHGDGVVAEKLGGDGGGEDDQREHHPR